MPGNDRLDTLAARAGRDPFFLGWALASSQKRHGLDDAALAALLGCPLAELAGLRLCRQPGAGGADAEGDVAEIARSYGLDAEALERVLAEAE
jgi:hypothetical protein